MKRFSEIIIKWRKLIIIITIIITLFFVYGFTKLSVNSDITSYLKPGDPSMILFNRIGDEYGGNLMVMIAVVADDIVTPGTLNFLKELTDTYSEIEGISSVTSLINIIDIRETEFGLEVGKLIDGSKIPQNRTDLDTLRQYILSRDTYRGKVISEDGTATIIICRLDPEYNKIELAKIIKSTTEKQKGEYKIYYSGYPIQMMEMSSLLTGDLKVLIPIVLAVIILVLFFSFRTLRGVVLPLLVVVISAIWAMGLMGLTGTEMSIISNVVPVILLAVGTAYGIHFLSRYYEDIRSENEKLPQIKKTIRHIGVPIFLTGITTIIGFLSFSGAYITAITEFGIFTAFGVLIAMMLSVTFLPAVLSFMKVEKKKATGTGSRPFTIFMNNMAKFVLKYKRYIIIFGALVLLLSAAVIPRIKTQTDLANFFPKKSEVRKADVVINDNFGGSIPVQIMIQGDVKDPFVLREIMMMEKFLEQLPYMSNTLSLADLITRMNDILNGHKTIPQTREEVANLLFLLEGDEILDQLVNNEYSEGIIQATYKIEDSRILSETVAGIESYIQQYFSGSFITVSMDTLEGRDRIKVEDWWYGFISRSIFYDLGLQPNNPEISVVSIKDTLKAINISEEPYLISEIKKSLYSDLVIFFEEESEILIDTRSEIESAAKTLADLTEHNSITEELLVSALKNNIDGKYWSDYPESIQYTAEYILPALQKAQNETFVRRVSEQLIKNIDPDRLGEKDLLKKVRDDLWLLSHDIAVVPASLLPDKADIFEKSSLNMDVSGMITIVDRLNASLRKSQIQSIIIAIVVVFILLSLQFKSIKMGAVALSPIILVILLNFAIMGYFSIPLDYATMLVGSIIIGVGIDYSIHFSSRFRLESKNSRSGSEALHKTLGTAGVAIFINAMMVALGFFVLIAGNIVPVKREGWMIGVLMILSAFCSLVFLPSLILILKKF